MRFFDYHQWCGFNDFSGLMQVLEQVGQSDRFRKLHHFTVKTTLVSTWVDLSQWSTVWCVGTRLQGVTVERSLVRDVKASSSGAWGRTWPTVAAVNRTASSTNTTAVAASFASWGNVLRWEWRLFIQHLFHVISWHDDIQNLRGSEVSNHCNCMYHDHRPALFHFNFWWCVAGSWTTY